MTISKSEKIEAFITGLAAFTTILSFGDFNVFSSICSKLMYIFWALLAMYKMHYTKYKINKTIKLMIFIYILFFILIKTFYYLGFYPSGGLGAVGFIGYCTIFYMIGFNSYYTSEKTIKTILMMAFVAYFILMCSSFALIKELDGMVYISKNQLGQMLGLAVIMETMILPSLFKSFKVKICFFLSGGITLLALFQLRSRTPLLGLAAVSIAAFVQKKKKSKKDYVYAILVVLSICACISFLGGTDFLINLFDLKGAKLNTLEGINNLSSERLDWYKIAIEGIIKSPFIGLGSYAYIDNFILCTLRCGGILLAVFLLPFVYGELYKEFKVTNKYLQSSHIVTDDKLVILKLANRLSIFYFIISIMEGYPPIGPGTSVFWLWLVYGLVDNMVKKG